MTLRRETVAEQSAELLRARMLAGALRPGDPVTEEAMARDIGISRPTMREVLGILAVEGLLTRDGHTRVLHVTHLSAREVREAYVTRRLLESAGISAAAEAEAPDLSELERATEQLVSAVRSGDRPGVALADIACHVATVGLIGSPDLVDFYRKTLTKLELAMAAGMRSAPELREALDVHQEFLNLMHSRQFDAARTQLLARLEQAEAEQLDIIERPEA